MGTHRASCFVLLALWAAGALLGCRAPRVLSAHPCDRLARSESVVLRLTSLEVRIASFTRSVGNWRSLAAADTSVRKSLASAFARFYEATHPVVLNGATGRLELGSAGTATMVTNMGIGTGETRLGGRWTCSGNVLGLTFDSPPEPGASGFDIWPESARVVESDSHETCVVGEWGANRSFYVSMTFAPVESDTEAR